MAALSYDLFQSPWLWRGFSKCNVKRFVILFKISFYVALNIFFLQSKKHKLRNSRPMKLYHLVSLNWNTTCLYVVNLTGSWNWHNAQGMGRGGSTGAHGSFLPLGSLEGLSGTVLFNIKNVLHTTNCQIFISTAFSVNISAIFQYNKTQHQMWFMNKTTKPDSPVNRHGMTYELQIYHLLYCMMPQLCDSHWWCTPPTWASILYLKSLVFSAAQKH